MITYYLLSRLFQWLIFRSHLEKLYWFFFPTFAYCIYFYFSLHIFISQESRASSQMEEIFFPKNGISLLLLFFFFLKPSKCIRIPSLSVVPSVIWSLAGANQKGASGMDCKGGQLRVSINYAHQQVLLKEMSMANFHSHHSTILANTQESIHR